MRAFAPEPKAAQQRPSATPAIPARVPFWQGGMVTSSLPLLNAPAAEIEADSATADRAPSSHDFSWIPVHRKAPIEAQATLAINPPGDEYEQEADRVADQVMTTPSRLLAPGALPSIQRVGGLPNRPLESAPATLKRALASPGRPLEPVVRQEMEPRFGYDFSLVRVHSDAAAGQSARDVNAHAYTVGHHIVLGTGQFAQGSRLGRRLIAHELTHVVQQAGDPGMIQRAPLGPDAPSIHVGPFSVDVDLEGLQVAGGMLDLTRDLLTSQPLSAEEMWELLLVRRAEPLSIPASVVNEAPAKLGELDAKIAALDQRIKEMGAELGPLQEKRRRARGFPREMIQWEITKLQTEGKQLAPQRKQLLSERVRLRRGQALGTIGKGAPAGTGQITYAGIQVIDASGKRIALEFAETSATEHAEERIISRLRAALTPEQLKGARIVVVGDQQVCGARCRPALVAFAKEFGVESVEAVRRVRPRIGQPGEASARTTLRTATQARSAGLPVREVRDELYRRPPSSAKPAGAEPPAPAKVVTVTADAPAASKSVKTVTGPEAEPARRSPLAGEPYSPTVRSRLGTAGEIGGNLVIDLVLDLVLRKYQQWRNDRDLRDRLEALQPSISAKKRQTLSTFLRDPWANGTSGFYYNVILRITATTTTAIGGGRAVVIPGSPRPEIVQVTISASNMNRLITEDEAVRLFSLKEGATGAVYQSSDTQLVVYSEPLQ